MSMEIRFPGGVAVSAQYKGFIIATDQPEANGGTNSAPSPFDLFLASLPWVLRGVVRRFALPSILDKYYDPRAVLLDLLGNLHKEQLAHRVPSLLELANRKLEPPLTLQEIHRYYRSDARVWTLLQALRRVDRALQRLLGLPYPFVLPGVIPR